jgi:hypothetical protein
MARRHRAGGLPPRHNEIECETDASSLRTALVGLINGSFYALLSLGWP